MRSNLTKSALRGGVGFRGVVLISLGLLLTGQVNGVAQAAPLAATAQRPLDETTGGATRMSIVPEVSEARYRIRLQLIGQPPSESICSTRAVSGDLVLGPNGGIVAALSRIVVDQRTLHCSPPVSDGSVQSTLETQLFPTADFVVRDAPGLPVPLPTLGDNAFQFVGDQTIHGVTRPVAFNVTASSTEQVMAGLASTRLRMSDFNMRPPRMGPLMTVDDNLVVEFDFQAAISTAAL